ncbi:uncharacterized protein BT62DRAFT_932114 [Guyanagaster necrorhizus]|uniref:Uncharacterized protein n=1 Tax=Guyanagaster necrorhizus TaxID=856835 RepID=A0A9P7VSJ9_9AGAR|nr:uncharacterized protein BT62DRAFT_932114 [Guyanagaster necrorhizus MCA 3950]KAG7446671.1 hypothetical protein BT62DRAFT_932114 [Guyanagaster necrorhizus MCA 3950]
MAFLLRTSVVLAFAMAFANAAPASSDVSDSGTVVPVSTYTASRIEHALVDYSPYLIDVTSMLTFTEYSTSTADAAAATD